MTEQQAYEWGRNRLGEWLLQGSVRGRAAARQGQADLQALRRLCRRAVPHSDPAHRAPLDALRDSLWMVDREADAAADCLRGLRLPAVPFDGRCARVQLVGERLAEPTFQSWAALRAALEGLSEARPFTQAELEGLRAALVLGIVYRLRRLAEALLEPYGDIGHISVKSSPFGVFSQNHAQDPSEAGPSAAGGHESEHRQNTVSDDRKQPNSSDLPPSSSPALSEHLHRCLTLLRRVTAQNWDQLTEDLSPTHRILLRDAVYPKMDADSRRLCRRELARLARRSGRTESEAAAALLERAGDSSATTLLFPSPSGGGGWYPALVLLLSAAMTAAAAVLLPVGWWAPALLLPCSELARSVLDRTLSRLVRTRPVLRLELAEGLPPEGRTLCVIPALLTEETAAELAQRLEALYLTNRDAGPEAVYALLCDLPDRRTPPDAACTSALQKAEASIRTLNRRWGERFLLLSREPEYVPSEELYRGWERKRGALMELLELLVKAPSALRVQGASPALLDGVRYLLTLDSDTRLCPGGVRTLVGALLHPANAPILDRQRRRVVRGHGLLQPRMCVQKGLTAFAALYSATCPSQPYGGGGGLYHDVFDRASYCGKGLLHVEAARLCLRGRMPENRILSHDLLEGALLRAGACPQAEAADGFPSSPQSFFRRAHRWVRGDWQVGRWCADREVCALDRWKLFDNLRRSLLPVFLLFWLLFWALFPCSASTVGALLSLLTLSAPLLTRLADALLHPSRLRPQRPFALRLDGLTGEALRLLSALSLLPVEVWTNASAAASALWRMCVTRRGLLEWTVAGQEGRQPRFWLPNLFTGAAVLVRLLWALLWSVSPGPLEPSGDAAAMGTLPPVVSDVRSLWAVWALAALWLLSPFFWTLSTRAGRAQRHPALSERDSTFLRRQAALLWSYFDHWLRAEDHFLPPDNVQERPNLGPARRTSPTNLGLSLLSCLAALDLGLAERERCLYLIERQLKTIECLEKFRGHLYNWYSTATLQVLTPKLVSTVDSGNLRACLLTLAAGLEEREGGEALAHRARALAAAMDFRCLWDPERQLFYIGWDEEAHRFTEGHYDLLASEARLTSYLAVAEGEVGAEHWNALSRSVCAVSGRFGLVSWTGTLFEYFMPHLLLDAPRGSALWESLCLCVWAQRRWARRRRLPWGVSESGYYQVDAGQSYQYKAHGVPDLALCPGLDRERVAAPYASFLALLTAPRQAVSNLRALQRLGAEGRHGFYEAVDFTPRRTGGGPMVVQSWMAHHQGMSLLAVDNALNGGVMRRRFHRAPELRAFRMLLEEPFPLVLSRPKKTDNHSPVERSSMESLPIVQRQGVGFDRRRDACHLLCAGALTLPGLADGTATLWREESLLTLPEELTFTADGHCHHLIPRCGGGNELRWRWRGTRFQMDLDLPELRLRFTRTLSSCGVLCEVVLTTRCAGTLTLRIRPVLDRQEVFAAHPAFSRLGLERRALPSGVYVKARQRRRGAGLALVWEGQALLREGAADTLLLSMDLDAGPHRLRWALCPGEEREAYRAAQSLLLGLHSGDEDTLCRHAQALSLRSEDLRRADAVAGALLYPDASPGVTGGQRALWPFGLSGDLPLWVLPHADRSGAERCLRLWALLRRCGLVSDLVLLSPPALLPELERLCTSLALDALRGGRGGIHLLAEEVHTAEAICPMAELVGLPEPPPNSFHAALPAPERRVCSNEEHPPRRWRWEGDILCWNAQPGRHWSQILTNERFGWTADECGTGHLWQGNAHQNKLTPWYNDPTAEHGPERLFVVENGEKISVFAAEDGISTEVRYEPGLAQWTRSWPGHRLRLTAFVPPEGEERLFLLEAEGFAAGSELEWTLELQMGPRRREARYVTVWEENGRILAKNPTNPHLPGQVLTLAGSAPLRLEPLKEPGFARLRCVLRETLALSAGTGLHPTVEPEAVRELLERTRAHWREQVGTLTVETPDQALNRYLSVWGPYQALACRLMARTALYQCGGAYGFRDQLQDAALFVPDRPELLREQILRCCAHQYREGDVQHWWHPLPVTDWGVRTRVSDDLLWLPWAVERWVSVTGERGLLEERVPYLNSPPLADEEMDRCEAAEPSEETGTVREHCLRAIEQVLRRGKGVHGLLKLLRGDWNDGMDRLGAQGRGESVWLSWFAALVLKRFAPLCEPERRARYEEQAQALLLAAEESWDGGWYLRAWDDDGRPIGGQHSPYCQLDSVAQSFAVFAGGAQEARHRQALHAAIERLYDPRAQTLALLTPPFPAEGGAGYVCDYPEGVRENGAQYTHAAVWLAMACFALDEPEQGWTLLRSLLPEHHPTEVYEGEPHVLAADVYTAPATAGRAGWTWYTGSAAWFCRAAREELLGLKLRGGRLYVEPKLPKDWDGYRAVWRLREAELRLTVRRSDSARLRVDGVPAEQGVKLETLKGVHHLELG